MARILFPLLGFSLLVSICSFTLAVISLSQTQWIQSRSPHSSPLKTATDYGLFQRCDTLPWGDSTVCRKFPSRSQDCSASSSSTSRRIWSHIYGVAGPNDAMSEAEMRLVLEGRQSVDTLEKRRRLGREDDESDLWGFCDSWATAGYAQQLALVFGAAAILGNLAVLLGGRLKRESGWRIVAGLLSAHAALLIVSTSLVAHEFATDDRFYYGSRLGQSYIMSTSAWAIDVVCILGLVAVGVSGLMRQDDYEPIRD